MDNSVHSYLTYHLTTSQIEKRTIDIQRFFDDPELNADVLERYCVTFVLAGNPPSFRPQETGLKSEIVCYSPVGASKAKKYVKSHILKPVFENSDYTLYSVEKLPEKKIESFVPDDAEGKKALKPPEKISIE